MVSSARRKNYSKFTEEVNIAEMWVDHHTAKGYGHKTADGPKHFYTKQQMAYRLTLGYWCRPGKQRIKDHCQDRLTLYYCASPDSDFIFAMVDVDVLKAKGLGSVEGGRRFIDYLSQSVWPGLYKEESTNLKGQHGYLRVYVRGLDVEGRREVFDKLDAYVKYQARLTNADIEGAEVKGHCPIVEWQGQAAKVTNAGILAKLPRGLLTRLDELEATHTLSVEDVDRLYASIPEDEKSKKNKQTKTNSGSTAWLKIEDKPTVDGYTRLARTQGLHNLATSNRAKVWDKDFGYALYLVEKLTLANSEEGSMSTRRIEKLWNEGVDIGLHDSPFTARKWKVIRDKFSELGLIDWEDNTYVPGVEQPNGEYVKGRAMKWRLHDDALDILAQVREVQENTGGNTADTNFHQSVPQLRGGGEFLLPVMLVTVQTKPTRPLPHDYERQLDSVFALAG